MENLLRKLCVDTVVYWATPKADGRGGTTYELPTEIKGKWFVERKIIQGGEGDKPGEEVVSHSQVFILQDIEEGAYLYLGKLEDLSSEEQASPEIIKNAHKVLEFYRAKGINGKSTVRKVYL